MGKTNGKGLGSESIYSNLHSTPNRTQGRTNALSDLISGSRVDAVTRSKMVIENDYMNHRDMSTSLLLQSPKFQSDSDRFSQNPSMEHNSNSTAHIINNIITPHSSVPLSTATKVSLKFDDNSDYAVIHDSSNDSHPSLSGEQTIQHQSTLHMIKPEEKHQMHNPTPSLPHHHVVKNVQFSAQLISSDNPPPSSLSLSGPNPNGLFAHNDMLVSSSEEHHSNILSPHVDNPNLSAAAAVSLSNNNNNNNSNSKNNNVISNINNTLLQQSLSEAKQRVAQLKRELDTNYNLLTIIDKYYNRGNNSEANAIEV